MSPKRSPKAYRNLGVTMRVGARIEGLTETADAVSLTYRGPGAADAVTLTVDVVLQAIGFAPQYQGLRAREVGRNDRRPHRRHRHQRHHEATAGAPTLGVADYTMMPCVTFCQPQVASFGQTDAEPRADASARGSDIAVAKFPFRANGKAHGYGDPTGFAKVIAIARTGSCSARTWSASTSPSCCPTSPWPNAGI
jgi:dihydrolipoamide dehydrogenase